MHLTNDRLSDVTSLGQGYIYQRAVVATYVLHDNGIAKNKPHCMTLVPLSANHLPQLRGQKKLRLSSMMNCNTLFLCMDIRDCFTSGVDEDETILGLLQLETFKTALQPPAVKPPASVS